LDIKNNLIMLKRISTIGMGCVTFGREIDRNASFKMMDYAVERGISFFDTAAAYSAGISESIVGKWLASRGEAAGSIIVSTKLLPPFSAEELTASADISLKRLGTETIDLLFLHRWDPDLETYETTAALDGLLREGKVRALGASNFTFEQFRNAVNFQKDHGLTPFSFVQNNNNLAVSDIDSGFKQFCALNNVEMITYSPLGAGFLTGKHQQGVHPGSRFDLIKGHQDVYFNPHAYHRLERLQQVAARTGHTPAHLALAWAFHQQGIASVLIGGRTRAHIDQAFMASAFDDPDIFAELELV
jgi:aryl-alcohol dehydrogenase-like predicted oxidoreductase